MWRRLSARLDARLRTGARVVAVDPAARTVTLAGGEHIGFDHLVATGPLDRLAAITVGAPDTVRAAAGRLRHTMVAMVGGRAVRRRPPGRARAVRHQCGRLRGGRVLTACPATRKTPERVAGQAPDSVPAQTLRCRRCRRTAVPGPAGLNTHQLPAPPRCGQAGLHRRACGITGCGQPSRSAVSMNRRNIP
ncbi:FAD-dependent oxidoreductase [Streptomyces pseudogriseolus]|uniref:FAD-dependent oxidoreductase n=1 Tax=Streptomyces pseudogriseolus TaxID=36817 RepID=UPI0034940725